MSKRSFDMGVKAASTVAKDVIAGQLSPFNVVNAIPGISALKAGVDTVGMLSGYGRNPKSEEDKKDLVESTAAWSLLPGVAQHRVARRSRGVAEESLEEGFSEEDLVEYTIKQMELHGVKDTEDLQVHNPVVGSPAY